MLVFAEKKGGPVNILTHCNAGWLAFVDVGSATAPMYAAHAQGRRFHVYCDETRPRSQGATLTAWELAQQGLSHQIIADNAAGLLFSRGKIDLVILGSPNGTVGFFENDGTGQFTDRSFNTLPGWPPFPKVTLAYASGIALGDYNGDGLLDIYLTQELNQQTGQHHHLADHERNPDPRLPAVGDGQRSPLGGAHSVLQRRVASWNAADSTARAKASRTLRAVAAP